MVSAAKPAGGAGAGGGAMKLRGALRVRLWVQRRGGWWPLGGGSAWTHWLRENGLLPWALLVALAALLLSGCCALRHAGDPCVICINGKAHQVCDAPECGRSQPATTNGGRS